MEYESGNSALLIAYRKALIKAYELGENIKELYQIVPPAVLHEDAETTQSVRLSLNVH